MKLSALTSNKYYSSYEQPSTYIIKWPLLNSPENIHMHKNSPNIYLPQPLNTTPFFIFKNCGMPSFLHYANIYQQKRAVQHTNISKQKITTYLTLSFHHTHILNPLQQNKTIKNSQDHLESILLKMKLFPPKNHQITCQNNCRHE